MDLSLIDLMDLGLIDLMDLVNPGSETEIWSILDLRLRSGHLTPEISELLDSMTEVSSH